MTPPLKRRKWSLPGSDGEPIRGETHVPGSTPRGSVIIAHGFKGYKEYGMFPCLAAGIARRGYLAHRFNFSHSGMTEEIDTFARPDLFEKDTWNRQVADLRSIVAAMHSGEVPGGGRPHVLLGHSRGGVAVLLAAGRGADDPKHVPPAGVITLAAPDTAHRFTDEEAALLKKQGYLESPSARTGQTLRVGRAFLQEQLDEPERHDVLALTARIRAPLLILHGSDDETVPATCATALGEAATAGARVGIIPGADHVFGTPNPFPEDGRPSEALAIVEAEIESFLQLAIR